MPSAMKHRQPGNGILVLQPTIQSRPRGPPTKPIINNVSSRKNNLEFCIVAAATEFERAWINYIEIQSCNGLPRMAGKHLRKMLPKQLANDFEIPFIRRAIRTAILQAGLQKTASPS